LTEKVSSFASRTSAFGGAKGDILAPTKARRSNSPMRISVIIPAWNEAANIGACVRSAWQAGAKEVIVADGGCHAV
jgi:tRNA G18 (ribose-2'-O)-methylase SpoU